MKKFTIMLMAAFIAVVSYAQVPSAKTLRTLPTQRTLTSGKNLKKGADKTASQHMARLAASRINGVVMREESQPEVVTPPAGLKESLYTMYTDYCYSEEDAYSMTVTLAFNGNDVYLQGLCPYLPEAWVKGILEDGKMTIPTGQYFGTYGSRYPMYLLGGHQEQTAEDDPETEDVDESDYEIVIEDLVFDIDDETGVISNSDQYLFTNGKADQLGFYDFFFAPEFTPITCEPITVPADLEPVNYIMSGEYTYSTKNAYSKKVNVAFDGDDVYIQGINDYIPEAWVKGTIEDGKMTIPTGQAFGVYNYQGYKYPMYLLGYYEEQIAEDDPETEDVDEEDWQISIEDLVFDVEEETGTMINCSDHEQYLFVNGEPDEISFFDYYYAPTFEFYSPDAVWVANEQGYEDQQVISEITIGEGIIGTLDAGGSDKSPKYVEAETIEAQTLRMYAGNTLTISSEKAMSKIVITMYSKANLTANVGEYTLDGTVGTWTGEEKEVVFTSSDQTWIQKIEIFYFDYSTTLVEAPEGLETELYSYKGTDTYFEEDFNYPVQVGFDGDMVYIQGLSAELPEAWVKGKLENGKVTIPGWYLGQTYVSDYGYFDLTLGETELTYDAETNVFTTESIVTYLMGSMEWETYANVVIEKVNDVAAVPADPEYYAVNVDNKYALLDLPTTDVDGNILLPEKLFFTLYTDVKGEVSPLVFPSAIYTDLEEDLTIFPYDFSCDEIFDYNGHKAVFFLQEDFDTWNKIGVQSFYMGGDEMHSSEIVWYTIKEEVATGIENVGAAETATYTDLMGRKATKATKGLVIKTVKKADGTVKSIKMVRK